MDFSQWVPPGTSVVGQCSLCGGAVVAPTVWGGITPPPISCSQCGAVSSGYCGLRPMRTPALPILPMDDFLDEIYADRVKRNPRFGEEIQRAIERIRDRQKVRRDGRAPPSHDPLAAAVNAVFEDIDPGGDSCTRWDLLDVLRHWPSAVGLARAILEAHDPGSKERK